MPQKSKKKPAPAARHVRGRVIKPKEPFFKLFWEGVLGGNTEPHAQKR